MTKPFRLLVRLKNNNLIKAREEAGYPSLVATAKAAGVDARCLCAFENLAMTPVCKDGSWRTAAVRLARFYKKDLHMLWPDAVFSVTRTKGELEMDAPEGLFLPDPGRTPEDHLLETEEAALVNQLLKRCSPMEQRIYDNYCDGMTLLEIGNNYGLSRERIRQILQKIAREVRNNVKKLDTPAAPPQNPFPAYVPTPRSMAFCRCGHRYDAHAGGLACLGQVDSSHPCGCSRDFISRLPKEAKMRDLFLLQQECEDCGHSLWSHFTREVQHSCHVSIPCRKQCSCQKFQRTGND
jgi:RNA polymerase sigma factor (sigma-70 family)